MNSADNNSQSELENLRAEIQRLREENQSLRKTLLNARDATPVKRLSFDRVNRVVQNACMTLERCGSFWLLKMGHLFRRFSHLRDIWELLSADEWNLSDIFTAEELAKELDSSIYQSRDKYLLKNNRNYMISTFRNLSNLWCHLTSKCKPLLEEALKLLALYAQKYEAHKKNRWREKLIKTEGANNGNLPNPQRQCRPVGIGAPPIPVGSH